MPYLHGGFVGESRRSRPAKAICAVLAVGSVLSAPFLTPLSAQSGSQSVKGKAWSHYGGDAGGTRYSPLTQIDRSNVSQLEVAWTYRSGDVSDGSRGMKRTKFEATPIQLAGKLIFSTPFSRVIALNPVDGRQAWSFDPAIDLKENYSESLVTRGVAGWEDPGAGPSGPCRRRVLFASQDAQLHSIDADSGEPCQSFGRNGRVDLKTGIGPVEAGEYEVTSPRAVIGDIVIVGSAIGDNRKVDVERGVVRAYSVRDGGLLWSWDPIPRRPSDPGWSTWTPEAARRTGGANAWSILATDPERGLVFVPTGSAAPDFYGGERPGDNLYANCVVALHAKTGKIAWHFQVVRHDVWDYDVAAQPLLADVRRSGRSVPAVIVNTKMGHVFVLHRESGEPLFPIEERAVPASDVPGETTSPTQPFPVLPPPLYAADFSPEKAFGRDEEERLACRSLLEGLRYEGIFTPPSLQGSLIFPGYVGGVNWGSAAMDERRGVMLANVNSLAFWVRLHPRQQYEERRRDARRVQRRAQFTAQRGTPYGMSRSLAASPRGGPCVPPPWGRTVAIDMATGKIKWEAPAASYLFGGPIVTAGGLVFLSGGEDERLRALDVESGRELWSTGLPAGGMSTPMTYEAQGRQYLVIAAGGHGDLRARLGDYLIAYALPRE